MNTTFLPPLLSSQTFSAVIKVTLSILCRQESADSLLEMGKRAISKVFSWHVDCLLSDV